MKPLFSVIIPTYNRAYVLWRAVQSVLAQTESRWEIIVVDDCSTDCTLRLLEEFRDPRIRALTVSRQGAAAARNRGLEIARAPYVAYLDSDNTWHPDFLKIMLEAIQQDEEFVLWYCGQNYTVWERTEDGQWFLVSQSAEPGRQYTSEEIWQLKGSDTNCMVHRRSILEYIGAWDELCLWGEDWDLFLRVSLQYPDKMKWIPHILVEYRQVYGTGADGVCAETRENKYAEVRNRQYLLKKWGHHPDFAAARSLNVRADDLLPMRAKIAGR